jgi:hypothetical protein
VAKTPAGVAQVLVDDSREVFPAFDVTLDHFRDRSLATPLPAISTKRDSTRNRPADQACNICQTLLHSCTPTGHQMLTVGGMFWRGVRSANRSKLSPASAVPISEDGTPMVRRFEIRVPEAYADGAHIILDQNNACVG